MGCPTVGHEHPAVIENLAVQSASGRDHQILLEHRLILEHVLPGLEEVDGRGSYPSEEDLPEPTEVRPRSKAPWHDVHQRAGLREKLGGDRHKDGVHIGLSMHDGGPRNGSRVVLAYLAVRWTQDFGQVAKIGSCS